MTKYQRNYAELAVDYDKRRFESRKGFFVTSVDSMIIREMINIAGVNTIVDVPTGTGRVAEYLSKSEVMVYGCDLTREMLERASQRRSANNSLRFDLVQSDASVLPFRNDSIEGIICLRFFHLFSPSELHVFVDEFRRVLKPGGYIICSYTNKYYGGCVNSVRKKLKKFGPSLMDTNAFLELFKGWKVVAARGNFLPFQRFSVALGTGFSLRLSRIVSRSLLQKFCFERFFLLQKTK